jgi:hypothetical protein
MLQRFHDWPLLAVPGQHDLRNHSYEALENTPYGLMMQAGAIKDISGLICWSVDPTDRCNFKYRLPSGDERRCGPTPWKTYQSNSDSNVKVSITGFAWDSIDAGAVAERIEKANTEGSIKVAITHQYVYANTATNPAQFSQGNASELSDTFKGFDVVFAGDNHTPFAYRRSSKHPLIINCGSMQSTTIRQRGKHQPKMYLLCSTPSGFEVVSIPVQIDSVWASTEVLRLIEANNDVLQGFTLSLARIGDRFTTATIAAALQEFLGTIGKSHLSPQLVSLINAIRDNEDEVEV